MKVVIVWIQLTQFLNPIYCALRCGIGGGWVVGTFGRGWVLEGVVCKCASGDFMSRGKLFLQPSSTGIAATGDFFLSSSFLIHSFFFFRTQHLQIDEDFAACLHLLEKSSSIQELLYGSNLFRCRLPRRLRPSCRRAKRDSPPKLPSNVLPTTRAGTPSKRKHSMKNSVTLS